MPITNDHLRTLPRAPDEWELHAGPVVYIVQPEGSSLVKIGWTSDIRRRLSALQGNSPLLIRWISTHPGPLELETFVHRRLAARRRHGEWFDFSDIAVVQIVPPLFAEWTIRDLQGRMSDGNRDASIALDLYSR